MIKIFILIIKQNIYKIIMTKKYKVCKDLDESDYKNLLIDIIDYLIEINKDWKDEKIFIEGENDYYLTEFENRSKKSEIGALASSDIVGSLTLLFLRMIIDNYFELLLFYLLYESNESNNELNVKYYSIKKIMEIISKYKTLYVNIFSKNENIIVIYWTCKNGEFIKNKIIKNHNDIDLWDLNRIKNYIVNNDIKLNKKLL